MKYITIITIIILAGINSLLAQENEEYSKWEIYGGYSTLRPVTEQSTGKQIEKRGYEFSVTRNVNRYLGLKFDHSGHYRSASNPLTINGSPNQLNFKNSFYTYTGGVQIKDNQAKGRVKPFAHALVGVSTSSLDFTFSNCPAPPIPCESTQKVNALTMIFGGGVDVKVNRRFSVRPLQVDYVRSNKELTDGFMKNNVRLGAGIVFHADPVEIPAAARPEKYAPYEFHAGYSYGKTDLPDGQTFGTLNTKPLHGYNASIKWNFLRFLGAEFEHGGSWAGAENSLSNVTVKRSLHTFAGGLQVKDNSTGTRLKPFGHVLVGTAISGNKGNIVLNNTPTNVVSSEHGLLMIFGGGLDVKVKNNFSVRVFQLDYLRTRHATTDSSYYINYFRFGAGIVFH